MLKYFRTNLLVATARRKSSLGIWILAGACLTLVAFVISIQARSGGANLAVTSTGNSGAALGKVVTFRGHTLLLNRHTHGTAGLMSVHLRPPRDNEPVPIPGGDFIPPDLAPPDGMLIHQFVPGPLGVNPLFEGEDVEPNGITNFRGFIAMAVLGGTATDAAGQVYDMMSDMRVYQGEYVAADGSHHHGTFVEI